MPENRGRESLGCDPIQGRRRQRHRIRRTPFRDHHPPPPLATAESTTIVSDTAIPKTDETSACRMYRQVIRPPLTSVPTTSNGTLAVPHTATAITSTAVRRIRRHRFRYRPTHKLCCTHPYTCQHPPECISFKIKIPAPEALPAPRMSISNLCGFWPSTPSIPISDIPFGL